MSSHEQDRNKTQRGQSPRQDSDLNRDLDQEMGLAGRVGQNPGQSLSPYQQGQQGVYPPVPADSQPQGLFAQGGYGSQTVRGQFGEASGFGYRSGQDDPQQNDGTDGQAKAARFSGSWDGPDRAQARDLPQKRALNDGRSDEGEAQYQHDRHYQSWRERQNRQFDEDWEAFNRERQSSFDDEFETWRRSRAANGSHVSVNADAGDPLTSPQGPGTGPSGMGNPDSDSVKDT